MTEYTVLLLDEDNFKIDSSHVYGLAAAKNQAEYFLSDTYAAAAGNTHNDMKTYKVEIHNDCDECVLIQWIR